MMLSTITLSPFLQSPALNSPTRSPSSVRFRPQAVTQAASPSVCPYEVLGLPVGASSEAIKTKYRSLARTCHPDVAVGPEAEEFVKINAAYSTLSDPDKCANYDRVVFRRARPVVGFSGYTSRNWETDQCW